MTTCRVPVECAERLRQSNIDVNATNFHALAAFCARQVKPIFAAWQFVPDVAIPLPDGVTATVLERAMATWAMSPDLDWSWLPTLSRSVGTPPGPVNTTGFTWRSEQLDLQEKLRPLLPGNIGLIEASTGVGKTHVFGELAQHLSRSEQVVIAVPTFVVGAQWQDTWQAMGYPPLAEVWGKARYGEDELAGERQVAALETARSAPAILCSHHVLPKLLATIGRVPTLLVDEAHLLDKAVMSVAGRFLPIGALGPWLVHWNDRHGLPSGTVGEVELPEKLLATIIKKMAPGQDELADDWRASIVCDERALPLVWLRHGQSAHGALQDLWDSVGRAWLFSGTLGTSAADGSRSIRQMVRRLALPAHRAQDLGRVRAPWRDKGVRVLLPAAVSAEDGRPWLSAYRDRKSTWWAEVAQELVHLDRRLKTLVLMTSYADIEAVHALLGSAHGMAASARDVPFEVTRAEFTQGESWAWLATGSAWAGMDLGGHVQRLVIATLPLPDPQALQLVAQVEDAVFDAVSRFKQGIGRAVRDASGAEREIVVMDGRINDRSRAWRAICQPFMQVLGEEFELHQTFTRKTPSLAIAG